MPDESTFERRAGKPPDEAHPTLEATETDPSDYADLRVAQPGEDPPGEDALGDAGRGAPDDRGRPNG